MVHVFKDQLCFKISRVFHAITTGTEWSFARETDIATQVEALLLRPSSTNWTKTMDLYWTRFLTFSDRN